MANVTLTPMAVAQHHATAAEFWETRSKILLNDLLAVRTELEQLRAELLRLRDLEIQPDKED